MAQQRILGSFIHLTIRIEEKYKYIYGCFDFMLALQRYIIWYRSTEKFMRKIRLEINETREKKIDEII